MMKKDKIKSSNQKIRSCIVCGHPLNMHIDEGNYWRCHAFGADFFQCECALRKDKANNKISFYDYDKRVNLQLKELKKHR